MKFKITIKKIHKMRARLARDVVSKKRVITVRNVKLGCAKNAIQLYIRWESLQIIAQRN